MKELFKGSTCTAQYVSDSKRVIFNFDGYPHIQEHKEMYTSVMANIDTNPITAIILDFRKMKGTFTGLNEWVIETMRPAIAKGLTKSAMVVNDDVFIAFAANDALKKITLIQVQVFKTREDAEAWLN